MTEDFDLNLDRAILGTSTARDHRLASRAVGGIGVPPADDCGSVEEQQQCTMESIFKALKLSESPKQRNSMPNARGYNSWPDEFREQRISGSLVSGKETLTEQQRQRQVMSRIVAERGLNPNQFDTAPKHARYFVIKSYNVIPPRVGFNCANSRKMMYIRVSSLIFGRVPRLGIAGWTKRIANQVVQDRFISSSASMLGPAFLISFVLMVVVNFAGWQG